MTSGPPVIPRLQVTDAVGQRSIAVDKPIITLGRRSKSDVRVADVGVSRLHAEIHAETDSWRLKDCGSRAGTFVNDVRKDEHPLAHGDRVRLGQMNSTTITFVVGDQLPAVERSAIAAASELQHMAGLLGGLRALGAGRVLDDVLTLVLDAALDVTGAERGFIMLANRDHVLEFKLGRGRGRLTLSGQTFATSRKIPEAVFATGRLGVFHDLLDEAMAPEHAGTVALGIRQVICAPLRVVHYVERAEDGSPHVTKLGVLYLDSQARGSLGSASTQSALELLTTEAAVAIENAHLYREALERAAVEQDLKVAAAIQRALLPVAHRAGGFVATAGVSIPCREMGGDFFDYVDLADGRFGFMLGDVAGKGSPAALLAAAVLGMFSAEATYQTSAAAVVTRLNRGLLRRNVDGRFLTAFYGILAPDGTLTYCNAGHNFPVLITATGVRRLDRGGLILGLFEHATFDEETIALQPGDRVIVFSDGVTDACDEAGHPFGDDRLLAAIATHHADGPQALLEALTANVRAFCGQTPANDDVTLLIVQYEATTDAGRAAV